MNICPRHNCDCPGILYLALHQYGMPFIKHGFTHSHPSLTRRNADLQRAGFQIIWGSGRHDVKGNEWRHSDEQAIHALLQEIQAPYTGLEYYEISRPLISIIDDNLLTRHSNPRIRKRTVARLARHLEVNGWWETSYDTGTT